MNLYHRQKVNIASAALKYGRMRNIRRDTLIHQDSLSKSLTDFERLSEHNKIKNLKYHILDCGTYTSDVCCPKYFEVLPMLDQLEIERLDRLVQFSDEILKSGAFNNKSDEWINRWSSKFSRNADRIKTSFTRGNQRCGFYDEK